MGKDTGFLEIERARNIYAPVVERLQHYQEFVVYPDNEEIGEQAARCMDCGIPFCQTGCPVHNIIPDWNDLTYRGDWQHAIAVLHSTNNFPEFTGRICPAPCEAACTLNINDDAVAIKSIERSIVDNAWNEGWILPQPPANKTGKRVAVIGGGPSGMACAQQLARAGHDVEILEKNERIGGLLRFGIPDFKMEKWLIDRRITQMEAEGVTFRPNTKVGDDGISTASLLADYDAVVIAAGCEHPRDLPVPGRDLDGVHYAMDFLPQQNRRGANLPTNAKDILATGKHVVVIGGGDTGSDCIGTSNRQGAAEVVQFELLPRPPHDEDKPLVWPHWPMKMRTSTSQEEGCEREWAVATKEFIGDENGRVKTLRAVRVRWQNTGGRMQMEEVAGSEFDLPAELILLAMGYVHPTKEGMLSELGVELDGRGNVRADDKDYCTSINKIFAAGDTRRGQSLVVWAIREGRQCARAVDMFLMGESALPR
ncbi:MAG: glutamate synthase subunit beta [Gammaproteobacteria bacterium WSBS_2016_MAG_OTU1]